MAALIPFEITKIWTNSDADLITYLGYPLVQCVRQRQTFVVDFLRGLRHTTELHSGRSISLYGRATIVNSLIAAKCWHILSVLPIPLEFLHNIRSILAAFINTKISPPLSWDLMVTAKSNGGLGIIDIYAQQKALCYRWLDPILFDRPNPPTISHYVRLHLRNHLTTEVLDIGLLFPAGRSSSSVRAPTSTVTMLFRSMDAIPREYSSVDRNPIECLLLPIPSVIASMTNFKLSPRLKTATIGDIFELQVTGLFLTPIPISRLPRHLKVVVRNFHNALSRANVLLHPFFHACLVPSPHNLYNQDDRPTIQAALNFASFRKGLYIQAQDPTFQENHGRTRSFRQMVVNATERRIPRTSVTDFRCWKQFWGLFLNHVQRNVIYRLIQSKIPTRLFRSYCNSQNDSHCALCLTQVENTFYFFFFCAAKECFWERLILEYLWPGTTLHMVINALHSLDFSMIETLPHKTSVRPPLVLIVAVAAIWSNTGNSSLMMCR